MPERTTIGIDWSMNSPSICVHEGNEWHFDNCSFRYFTGSRKCIIKSDKLFGFPIPLFDDSDPLNRWRENTKWAEARISHYTNSVIGLEGYSYGSKGSLPYSIAENCNTLKNKIKDIFPEKIIRIFSPGAIKKFATGKGNADKNMMFDAFVKETNFDLTQIIPTKPGGNPISDIVDSYYIAKLTYYESTKS